MLELFVIIAVSGLSFLFGLIVYSMLQTESGIPFENQIDAFLLPFIYKSIVINYNQVKETLDDIDDVVENMDVDAIVDNILVLIKDYPMCGNIKLSSILSREYLTRQVHSVIEGMDNGIDAFVVEFDDLFKNWMEKNPNA